MKNHFDGIIVVEGKTDVALLSTYIDAEYVISNGSAISDEVLDYLKFRSTNTKIVVLTDPDSPGKRIRDIIEQNVNNVSHCFIEKKYAIKNHKVGVAECDIDHLLEALNNVVTFSKSNKNTITMSDLFELGLVGPNSEILREKVTKHYHLGFVNGKTLLKRLNGLNLNKKEIEKLL